MDARTHRGALRAPWPGPGRRPCVLHLLLDSTSTLDVVPRFPASSFLAVPGSLLVNGRHTHATVPGQTARNAGTTQALVGHRLKIYTGRGSPETLGFPMLVLFLPLRQGRMATRVDPTLAFSSV